MTDVLAEKTALRRDLRARRKALPQDQRAAEAAATCRTLTPLLDGATALASYLALPEELDLAELHRRSWSQGRPVWLPRVVGQDLTWHPVTDPAHCPPGAYGIREPDPTRVPAAPLPPEALLLVPGVGFDSQGGRLGMGKGFYDRLLAPRRAWAIGVGFACQEVPRIPREGHDILLARLVLGGRLVTVAAD